MTDSPIEQQLRKEARKVIRAYFNNTFEYALEQFKDGVTIATLTNAEAKQKELDDPYLDKLEVLFDPYAARRAGLGDSEKPQLGEQPSEIKSVHLVPSKRQELLIRIDETKIIEAKLESVGAMKDVQWRRHQLRHLLTAVNGMTTDSPDTNNQATPSRNVNHKEPKV